MASAYHIATSGTKIHYLRHGGPAGPLIICLHGLGGSVKTFEPVVPFFPSTHDIILVDFPGHGHTLLNPSAPVSVDSHVNDIHNLITSIQAAKASPETPVIFIGHSLGAIVALHYAATYPTAVMGLVLLGPGRAAGHIPAVRKRMLDLAEGVRREGITFAAEAAAASNFYRDTPERAAALAAREAVRRAVASSDPEGYAKTCEAMVDLEHKDPDYGNIKCPVVLIAGDKDIISPVERSIGLSEILGGPNSVVVVKSGHQQILEDLDGVKKALSSFFPKL